MKDFLNKYISDRKIVIISDHKVKSLRVSAKFQYIVIAVVLASCAWLPFALGRAVAFDDISYENAQILDNNSEVEQRLYLMERNIDVLEHYLSKLYKDGKFFITGDIDDDLSNSKKLVELEKRKNKIVAYLSNYTQNKTVNIEKVLKESGVNYAAMLKDSNKKLGQGGPFIPASLGKTPEESIAKYAQYFNDNFVNDFQYLIALQDIVAALPFSSPVQTPRVTSGFGYRKDPFHRSYALHSGIDLVGHQNAAVHVTAPGIVRKASYGGAYGNMIVVQHKNGVTTRYAHLKKIYVKAGQIVQRGNVIGVQGSTGRSTGAHVHYEVRLNGKAVNPMRFLRYADKINFYEVKR